MLGITLKNSPLYLAGLLVLLVLIWILKIPFSRGVVKFRKWNKKRKERRKKKKRKSIVPLVMGEKKRKGRVKFVNRKFFINDWSTPLFFVLGIGVILYSFFGSFSYFVSFMDSIYSFVFDFVNHNNFTTVILAVFLSSIFVIISDLFEFLQRRKSSFVRVFAMILFAVLISLSFISFIGFIEVSGVSEINSVIFGAAFILMGFIVNHKRIFKRRVEEEDEDRKQAEEFVF